MSENKKCNTIDACNNFQQSFSKDPLEICEEFISIQGEGRDAGAHALFIRLSGCNLSCPWCDTKHSWKQGVATTQGDVIDRLLKFRREYGNNYIVWTGGEPLLQELRLYNVMDKTRDFYHALETNGTIIPDKPHLFNAIVVSPKPGQPFDGVRWLTIRNSYVKLVVDDIKEAIVFQGKYDFPTQWFFVMAKTAYPFDLVAQLEKESEIARGCIKHGFNFSPRLQLLYEVK